MNPARPVPHQSGNENCRAWSMTGRITSNSSPYDTTRKHAALSLVCLSTSSGRLARSSPLTASTPTSDMSVATAKSSHSASTQPRPAVSTFPALPSDGSFAEPAVSEKDAGLDLCICGSPTRKKFPEQLRCNRCRAQQLHAEFQYDQLEIAAFRRLREEWPREDTDWQLHDPDHPEVLIWASDLAKRYRYQTTPRPIRNNLRKWY